MLLATATVWDAVAGGFTFAGVLVNAALLLRNGRRLKTPSGDPIGAVAERSHDISAATLAAVTKQNGGKPGAGGDAG